MRKLNVKQTHCLRWGNPKTGNRNLESGTKNQNPETGNRNPEIKENKFFKYAKIVLLSFLPLKKNCSQVKLGPQT